MVIEADMPGIELPSTPQTRPPIVMLASCYIGAEYGGSVPAILIRTPGTNAAAATILDGYELNRQGRAGEALEELLVVQRPFSIVFGRRVVKKDQVDVARIIELNAAELAPSDPPRIGSAGSIHLQRSLQGRAADRAFRACSLSA